MAGESEPATCKNCNTVATQVLRCGVCKKATYCSASCQKEDWQFHKRLCKKPSPEEPKPKAPAKMGVDEMKRQMDELTKDKEPALAAQLQQMMAGVMGLEAKEQPKAPEPPPPCGSCGQPCSKPLRCGVCKSATYCSAACQKEDWRFHKRLCKKPEAPAAAAAPSAPVEVGSAALAAAARPKGENERLVVEGEDVGTWYKHRAWKPQEETQTFTPSKLDEAAAGREKAVSKGGAAGASASKWNAAGTWEERKMLPWWHERLQGLKGLSGTAGVEGESGFLELDSVGEIHGEASIVHVRGQPKFMYDLSFDLPFSGLQRCKPCSRNTTGSRCSNCVRFAGKLEVTDFSWDCEGDPCSWCPL